MALKHRGGDGWVCVAAPTFQRDARNELAPLPSRRSTLLERLRISHGSTNSLKRCFTTQQLSEPAIEGSFLFSGFRFRNSFLLSPEPVLGLKILHERPFAPDRTVPNWYSCPKKFFPVRLDRPVLRAKGVGLLSWSRRPGGARKAFATGCPRLRSYRRKDSGATSGDIGTGNEAEL